MNSAGVDISITTLPSGRLRVTFVRGEVAQMLTLSRDDMERLIRLLAKHLEAAA